MLSRAGWIRGGRDQGVGVGGRVRKGSGDQGVRKDQGVWSTAQELIVSITHQRQIVYLLYTPALSSVWGPGWCVETALKLVLSVPWSACVCVCVGYDIKIG